MSTPLQRIISFFTPTKKKSYHGGRVRSLGYPEQWNALSEAFNNYPGGYTSQALNVSAVFACNDRISKDIASLPFRPMKRTENGSEIAREHDQYFVSRQPSPLYTKSSFFYALNTHVNLWGNAYAPIDRKSGRPVAYGIWHPARVTNKIVNGALYWVYDPMEKGMEKMVWPDDDVLHGLWYTEDGINGRSVIGFARDTINLALSSNKLSSGLYQNQMYSPGYISYKDTLSKEQLDFLSDQWSGRIGEEFANIIPVLDKGSEFKHFGMSLKDAEYLGTKELTIRDIARFFGVPASKINIRDSNVSYNSLEQENIAYVQDTILPRCIMWEEEFERKALRDSEVEDVQFKFELKGRLRGDMAARSTFYQMALNTGLLSINDTLRLEDMDTIGKEGDERYINSAYVPLSKVHSGELEKENTPAKIKGSDILDVLTKASKNGNGHVKAGVQ